MKKGRHICLPFFFEKKSENWNLLQLINLDIANFKWNTAFVI